MNVKSLHTINARGHLMLEVVRDHFKLSSTQMYREIQYLRQITEDELAKKSIRYDELKSALVPDRQRREVALVFDSISIKSNLYGYEVFKRIIPLFEKRSSNSVLAGDLTTLVSSDELFDAFKEVVELRRNVVFQHQTQFYVVYVNNLTDSMVKRLDEGLSDMEGYVGVADMTFKSRFKLYLSLMLVNSFIKHRAIVLQGHEPDRRPDEDVNMHRYPFEENGYVCRSISSDYMGVLLSYKIERPVLPGFEVDTEFAINSVNPLPLPLDGFQIVVDEAKLQYIRSRKHGSMIRAGLTMMDNLQLAEVIRQKVSSSYIYNMAHDEKFDITKFNLIIEFDRTDVGIPTRLLAALEYQPAKKVLRLLTLY